MKDIISFETAKALKEAGFPQPEFETGQFWYNDLGALTFVGRNEVNERFGKDYFYCTSVEILAMTESEYGSKCGTLGIQSWQEARKEAEKRLKKSRKSNATQVEIEF